MTIPPPSPSPPPINPAANPIRTSFQGSVFACWFKASQPRTVVRFHLRCHKRTEQASSTYLAGSDSARTLLNAVVMRTAAIAVTSACDDMKSNNPRARTTTAASNRLYPTEL